MNLLICDQIVNNPSTHRADRDGRSLGSDIRSLSRVLESFNATGSQQLGHSWCIRDGDYRIILGHSNVTNRDVLKGISVDQCIRRIAIRKDFHPGAGSIEN